MTNLLNLKHGIHTVGLTFLTLLSSCTKDVVPVQTAETPKSYNSIGNLLILQVGENFEGIVEYELESTELVNGLLPITSEINDEDFDYQINWKFEPNTNTIFSIKNNKLIYTNNFIPLEEFYSVYPPIDFSTIEIQNFSPGIKTHPEEIWNKVADLDIVSTYRTANPNGKMGVMHVVSSEYNSETGVDLPVEKHLVFMVK